MKRKQINKKIVGQRIKQIRLSYGWTLKKFSNELSTLISENKLIAEGVISRWESGVSLPNPERLKAIATIGNITVEQLLWSYLDKDEFIKRMRNRDDDLRGLVFDKLVIFLNELKYSELNYVLRESEKINKIVSLIIKSETDDKEEKLKEFVNDLVDNLMSKTYILYWDFVYELCFSEDDIKREVYVSGMLFDFLMEYLQTDERYTLPLILFTLEEAKKDINSLIENISNDSKQPMYKDDLLKRIDDLIAFVSNVNK